MDEHTDNIDEQLRRDGDSRNVVNDYKTWKLSAIKADMQSRAFPLHIAIENFQHDQNIGSIVRTANACNAAGVHIVGKRHWNRRGAMATEKYLDVHHHSDIEGLLQWATQQNMQLIGIDNCSGSTPLTQARLPKNALYIFGQEGPGLSETTKNSCSSIIAIEQFGSTRSVNVGVAGGIVMYEWLRRNVLASTQN